MFRESLRSLRQSTTHSILLVITILLAALAVMLQYGQASNRAEELQTTFQQPEYRTATITDDREDPDLFSEDVTLVKNFSSIRRVWADSSAFDVFNAVIPSHGRASSLFVTGEFSHLPITLKTGRLPDSPLEAIAPVSQKKSLGLDASGGVVSTPDDYEYTIVGYFTADHPQAPQSTLVKPGLTAEVRSIVFEVDDVRNLDSTIAKVIELLDLDPSVISVEKSEGVANIQTQIDDAEQSYTTLTISTALAVITLIVALISAMMVNSRKQEFGRRRALGASRAFLIGLVTIQVSLTVLAAAFCGVICAMVGVAFIWPLGMPTFGFSIGLIGTLVMASVLAQLPSAFLAAYRDPVAVLRTP